MSSTPTEWVKGMKPVEDKFLLPGDFLTVTVHKGPDGSFTFDLPDRILKVWASGVETIRLRYDMPVKRVKA